jgi:FkbM family methyltransferase
MPKIVSPSLRATLRFIVRHPANRHRKARALLTFAGWQVWKRVVGRPITAGLPYGLRIHVYPDSRSASLALYTRLPEYDEMEFAVRLLRQGDVVVDVGANIGLYTLLAARHVEGGRVIAFEPHPLAAHRLRENVSLNGLGNVDVRAEAVGAASGEARLTQDLDTDNFILPDHETEPRAVTVHISTLDEVVPPGARPALVKVDTEGFETAVLAGATRLLADAAVTAWIVEAREHGSKYGHRDDTVLDTFRRAGYGSYVYHAEANRLEATEDPSLGSGWNLLFVKDLDTVLARLDATPSSARVP